MKTQNVLLTTIAILSSSLLSAQQQPEKIDSINKVIVSDGIVLQIERAPEFTLKIKSEDLQDDCLIKTIENGTLTLKIKSGFGCRGDVTVDLTCPTLTSIEATAKAQIASRNVLTGDSLSLLLRTGAKAFVDLDIKYLKIDLTEGALFSAQGYAVNQDISVSSFATYSGFKLEGDKVNVSTQSGGKAKLCANKELHAEAVGGGYVSYKCNPDKKTLEPKGNGTIEESND